MSHSRSSYACHVMTTCSVATEGVLIEALCGVRFMCQSLFNVKYCFPVFGVVRVIPSAFESRAPAPASWLSLTAFFLGVDGCCWGTWLGWSTRKGF